MVRDPATFRNRTISAKVSATLERRLKAEAKKLGMSLSLYIANILEK